MDQFRINQGDEDEKLVSIAAMDLIYKSARIVVILLEDISITKSQWDVYEKLVCHMAKDFSGSLPLEALPLETVKEASSMISHVLSARWFSANGVSMRIFAIISLSFLCLERNPAHCTSSVSKFSK